jgi:hypothetical protein
VAHDNFLHCAFVDQHNVLKAADTFFVIPSLYADFFPDPVNLDLPLTPVLMIWLATGSEKIATGISCSDELSATTETVGKKALRKHQRQCEQAYTSEHQIHGPILILFPPGQKPRVTPCFVGF